MNIYTSDGLLVQQCPGTPAIAAEHGQQLITIYRLFLQLHQAGSGAMRIKDMLKPESAESAGSGGDSRADRTGERRTNGGRGGALSHHWNSMVSMPEAAYTSSVAAVSTGTPYPMFLLSSNAIPETHRLRGFAAFGPSARVLAGQDGQSAAAATKNNNRSANGCEELALRWSLLTRQTPAHLAAAAAAAGAGAGAGAGGVAGSHAGHDSAAALDPTGAGGAARGDGAVSGAPRTSAALSSSSAAAPSNALLSFPSGWTAAELQLHTTHRVLVCTATEMHLEEAMEEDGGAPLVFCCSARATS